VTMSGAKVTGRLARLKSKLRASRTSTSPIVRLGIAAITAAYKAVLFVVDGKYRSVALLKGLNRGVVHQTTPDTWLDRYPRIFAACQTHLCERKDLRILSFGCSTGEEVLTLRRYFPSAFITGAEINRRSLAICRKREVDKRISFVYSERTILAQHGPFDAIFCMAVLQRTPQAVIQQGLIDLKRIYPFEKFDRQVAELDELLANGGLLVIRHTQYRLQDASVGWKYAALQTPAPEADTGPRFDRNSKRLPQGEAVPLVSFFVKTTP
jgi:hypothetical protein